VTCFGNIGILFLTPPSAHELACPCWNTRTWNMSSTHPPPTPAHTQIAAATPRKPSPPPSPPEQIILFGDDTILNKPVEEWPVVDCLLSWHSEGFPLRKAQQYVALRRPYLVNDVTAQDVLLDRRKVYRRLKVGSATQGGGGMGWGWG
jgi:hypothetical protein